jgi:hypothetical protein
MWLNAIHWSDVAVQCQIITVHNGRHKPSQDSWLLFMRTVSGAASGAECQRGCKLYIWQVSMDHNQASDQTQHHPSAKRVYKALHPQPELIQVLYKKFEDIEPGKVG